MTMISFLYKVWRWFKPFVKVIRWNFMNIIKKNCFQSFSLLRYLAHFDVRIKNDVTWRHVVEFSQNFVRLFLFIISYFCPSLKWIWCSKQKLLEIKNPAYQGGGCCTDFRIKYYDFFCSTFEEMTKLHTSKRFFLKNIQNRPKFNRSKILSHRKVVYPPIIE